MSKTNWKEAKLVYATIATSVLIGGPIVTLIVGGDYLLELKNRIILLAVSTLVCFTAWFIGIKVMHLDATGPVPWYASPVVWLSPVFILTLFFMFL